MIEPDQAPAEDESVGPHPPAKAEREQDLVFLQRCFKDSMCGEIENWPIETFRQYNATSPSRNRWRHTRDSSRLKPPCPRCS